MSDVQFGKYKLLEKIASGGMAVAWRAELTGAAGVKKRLVLKVIHPHLAKEKSFVSMFIAEAKLVASLTHVNIAQVFDFGEVDGQYYLAMEEVVGKPLSRVIRAARDAGYSRLPVALALQIGAGMLDGLHYAHTRRGENSNPLNIVHRDVTPDNVLLSYEGEVKLVDFGIAKTALSEEQTEIGRVRGKYPYLSPEQASGSRELDPRTDIWAVGVQLFELLCGRRPWEGEALQVMREVASGNPVPTLRAITPELDPEVEALVLKALKKPRDERYANAREFSQAITSYLHQHYPNSTRQELQFLLALLFPGDTHKEGVDVTVPPAFASEMQRTNGATAPLKATPIVVTSPPAPVPSAPKMLPKLDDDEATQHGDGAEEDEATVSGLPASKAPPVSKSKQVPRPDFATPSPLGISPQPATDQGQGKMPAQSLAEIRRTYHPEPPRPPSAPPVPTNELPAYPGAPGPTSDAPVARPSTPPTRSVPAPKVSGTRPKAKTGHMPQRLSGEMELKKDIGKATQRMSLLVGGFSLAAGALAITALVMWKANKTEEEATPKSTVAYVWVTSAPPGAMFKVDGTLQGKTPATARVLPGDHTITMEMPGYAPWSKTISATADQVMNLPAELELVGTGATLEDGGREVAVADPTTPTVAGETSAVTWPAAADEAHYAKAPKRFHTLRLAKMALPLDKYTPLRIPLDPKSAYAMSTSGVLTMGRGKSTGSLLYYLDMADRGPGQVGLLTGNPKTIKGARAIRVFAFDDDVKDNGGAISVISRISKLVPEKVYGFDVKKNVLVPRPEHQYRIEGMRAKEQYLLFTRLEKPALNKNWQGKASQLLCITHPAKPQPLSSTAKVIPLPSKVILDDAAGMTCFFLDDLTEDNSGSVELDIVDGTRVEEEGVNPKLYTPVGKW